MLAQNKFKYQNEFSVYLSRLTATHKMLLVQETSLTRVLLWKREKAFTSKSSNYFYQESFTLAKRNFHFRYKWINKSVCQIWVDRWLDIALASRDLKSFSQFITVNIYIDMPHWVLCLLLICIDFVDKYSETWPIVAFDLFPCEFWKLVEIFPRSFYASILTKIKIF